MRIWTRWGAAALLLFAGACTSESTRLDEVDEVDDDGAGSGGGGGGVDSGSGSGSGSGYDGPDGGVTDDGLVFTHDRADGFAMVDVEVISDLDEDVIFVAKVLNIGDLRRGYLTLEATAWDADGQPLGEPKSTSINGFVCQSESAHVAACLAPGEAGRVVLGIADAPRAEAAEIRYWVEFSDRTMSPSDTTVEVDPASIVETPDGDDRLVVAGELHNVGGAPAAFHYAPLEVFCFDADGSYVDRAFDEQLAFGEVLDPGERVAFQSARLWGAGVGACTFEYWLNWDAPE